MLEVSYDEIVPACFRETLFRVLKQSEIEIEFP